jgi:hypothetical protein
VHQLSIIVVLKMMMVQWSVNIVPKKSIYDSGTTKGSAPRTSDRKKYEDNWEKIFGKKNKEKKDVEKKDSNS